ncbi:MAG: M10 family metallopeptidase C-terminal domain-containing protein [Devosia sp.]
MPTVLTSSQYPMDHEIDVVASPQLFGSETVVATADEHWTFYWTLNASDVGKVVYALPDVVLVGDGTPGGSFINNEVTWGSIRVLQHYTMTQNGQTTSGFEEITSGSEVIDQVLQQQYAGYLANVSTFLKVTVPALRQDSSQNGVVVDYDNSLILSVSANNGELDENPFLTSGPPHAGRFLVTTNSPGGERAAAWGSGWIDVLDTGSGEPEPPDGDEELAGDVADLAGVLKKIVKGADYAEKTAQFVAAKGLFDAATELDDIADDFPYYPKMFQTIEPKDMYGEFVSNDPSKFSKAMKYSGAALNVLQAGAVGYQKAIETDNPWKGLAAGSVKLMAATIGGYYGTVVGTSLVGYAVVGLAGTSLLATGIPIAGALLVGYGVGKAFEWGVEYGIGYLVDSAMPANGADLMAPMSAVEASPAEVARPSSITLSYEYNVDTGKFKWLSKAAEKDFDRVTTILDINKAPIGLKLKGDKLMDKDDYMLGHGGRDTIAGGAGNDIAYGAKNNDSIKGGSGRDVLFGDAGNDTIAGGADRDFLTGGKGNDRITGGPGNDMLSGGAGKDVFVFLSVGDSRFPSDGDTIVDFQQGKDKIDFSKIDANTSKLGHQDIQLAHLSTYTDTSGPKPVVELYVDVDNDDAIDLTVTIEGVSTLYLSDFIL